MRSDVTDATPLASSTRSLSCSSLQSSTSSRYSVKVFHRPLPRPPPLYLGEPRVYQCERLPFRAGCGSAACSSFAAAMWIFTPTMLSFLRRPSPMRCYGLCRRLSCGVARSPLAAVTAWRLMHLAEGLCLQKEKHRPPPLSSLIVINMIDMF